jgi:hypothetical protein
MDNTHPTGYSSTDLKSLYLTREQLEARKVAQPITQYDLLSNK